MKNKLNFKKQNENETLLCCSYSLDEAKKTKCTKTVEEIDFTRSRREAWSLLAKQGDKNNKNVKESPMNPNQVAAHTLSEKRFQTPEINVSSLEFISLLLFLLLMSFCYQRDETNYSGCFWWNPSETSHPLWTPMGISHMH